MVKKRVEANDANAIYELGCSYRFGRMGLPQNHNKSHKLWLKAGKLGSAAGYNNIGASYHNGEGVKRDMKKAKYYYELSAMGGHAVARHNLGIVDENEGNYDSAMKNFMIAAEAGYDKALAAIRQGYLNGFVTKDDFEKALRAHKEAKDEMKSDQRAAAFELWQRE